jgi:hypothetical protein
VFVFSVLLYSVKEEEGSTVEKSIKILVLGRREQVHHTRKIVSNNQE